MSVDPGRTSWEGEAAPRPDTLVHRTPALAELLDVPALSGMVEGFAALQGMGVQVLDTQGVCLAGSQGPQGPFCPHLTAGAPEGEACPVRAPLSSGLHVLACPGGARYLVLQVRWEGSELGRAVFGPFAPEAVAALPERMDVARASEQGSVPVRAAAYFAQVLEALLAVGHRSWLASHIQLESAGEIRRELEVRDARMASLQGRLREMDRLQSSFLGTVSHELRTPLASIIAYSELLAEGITGPINPEQQQCVQAITEMGRTLLDLITSILDISQLEAGKLRLAFAPVDMAEVVVSAVSSVTPQSRRKGLKLEVVLPELRQPRVLADKGRMHQVLVNLLANAVKFTPEGHVRVRLSDVGPQAELDAPGYRIAVEDSGVGIRADQLERIFQTFYQVDSSSTREFGGVGLGLSIVKRFVEGHGGKVLVESQPGQGSCFTAVVPARPPQVGEGGVHVLPPLPEPDRF